MSTHEFEILSMPMEIDKEIFHIVRWMNSLPGVRTLYCCQGNSLKELQSKFGMGRMEAEFWYEHPDFFAHVLFRCCSYSSLKKIQQACPSHEVIFCPIDKHDRYNIRWHKSTNKAFNSWCAEQLKRVSKNKRRKHGR